MRALAFSSGAFALLLVLPLGCSTIELPDPDACKASPSDPKSDALVDAAEKGDEAALDRALGAGASPRYVDGRKNEVLGFPTCDTALQQAAAKGHVGMLRKLLAAGGDPSHRAYADWTPLHYAAQGRHIECVNVLIEAKADVNAKTSLGYTPLYEAVGVDSVEAAKILLAAGADPDIATPDGRSARSLAQQRGAAMKALIPAK